MPQWRIMLVGGIIGGFALLIIFLPMNALRKTEADLGHRLTIEKRKVETHERTIERLEKEIVTLEEKIPPPTTIGSVLTYLFKGEAEGSSEVSGEATIEALSSEGEGTGETSGEATTP